MKVIVFASFLAHCSCTLQKESNAHAGNFAAGGSINSVPSTGNDLSLTSLTSSENRINAASSDNESLKNSFLSRRIVPEFIEDILKSFVREDTPFFRICINESILSEIKETDEHKKVIQSLLEKNIHGLQTNGRGDVVSFLQSLPVDLRIAPYMNEQILSEVINQADSSKAIDRVKRNIIRNVAYWGGYSDYWSDDTPYEFATRILLRRKLDYYAISAILLSDLLDECLFEELVKDHKFELHVSVKLGEAVDQCMSAHWKDEKLRESIILRANSFLPKSVTLLKMDAAKTPFDNECQALIRKLEKDWLRGCNDDDVSEDEFHGALVSNLRRRYLRRDHIMALEKKPAFKIVETVEYCVRSLVMYIGLMILVLLDFLSGTYD